MSLIDALPLQLYIFTYIAGTSLFNNNTMNYHKCGRLAGLNFREFEPNEVFTGKLLQCLGQKCLLPYSGFILRGFKSCKLPASQHLISQENCACKFLELVVYLRWRSRELPRGSGIYVDFGLLLSVFFKVIPKSKGATLQ